MSTSLCKTRLPFFFFVWRSVKFRSERNRQILLLNVRYNVGERFWFKMFREENLSEWFICSETRSRKLPSCFVAASYTWRDCSIWSGVTSCQYHHGHHCHHHIIIPPSSYSYSLPSPFEAELRVGRLPAEGRGTSSPPTGSS